MPTYTYACKQCDHRFDQRQSFSDPALTVCPKCTGNLRKVLNSVVVVFKGSGFYRTDSRAGAKPGAKPGAAAAGSGDGAKPQAKASSESASSKPSGAEGAAAAKKPVGANA
jgi:putative FmdB family regulatory protein